MDNRHLDGDALCDYAEGLLAPDARREAEAHLDGCADCRRELEAVGAYFREMAALPVHKAPEKFLTRVHARIDRASPWKRLLALLSSPRLLPVPLAVFVVAGVGAYLALVSRDLTGPAQAGSGPALREERLATLPPPPAEKVELAEQAEKDDQVEQDGQDGQAEKAGKAAQAPSVETKRDNPGLRPGKETVRKAEAAPAVERSALARRPISRTDAGPAASAAGGKPGPPEAPAAPKPAPAEPPLVSSVTKASGEVAPVLEDKQRVESGSEALAWSDRDEIAGGLGEAAKGLDEARQVSGFARASKRKAPASSRREMTIVSEAGPETGADSPAAQDAGDRDPWRDPGLLLEWNPEADRGSFFDGIENLGIRILRSEESRIHRYELLVPAESLDALETYLRARGRLTRVSELMVSGKAGDSAVITLRILGDFSGR